MRACIACILKHTVICIVTFGDVAGWMSMLQFIGPVYLAATGDYRDTLTIYDGEVNTGHILTNASGYHGTDQ